MYNILTLNCFEQHLAHKQKACIKHTLKWSFWPLVFNGGEDLFQEATVSSEPFKN